MDVLVTLLLTITTQTTALLMEGRQLIGLAAAIILAMMAGQLGWKGTDRVIAWRQRPDQD
ncbi:hypothetical protein GCM10009678_25370 [Actinomadura kijaniata]|uniref:Uncharacterized protein n=1 Tax=Actinomadura namibiensis TaxID=182080 RepID=A0A7W3LUH5_ACTNM|nr:MULTISPECIES: hypothetical protein [Actinomadura]MBA8954529.1 hypothetical protein [Actinomadura namibiensis]